MEPASEARFYPTADNPCPPGGSAYFLPLGPALRIRVGFWPGGRRGTVFVLPGRTEFIEKYFETVGELAARDFSVAVIDWRGQGASSRLLPDPLKSHIDRFEDYLADFLSVRTAFEAEAPAPRYMLAHSMGGTIGIRALHDWPDAFDGAVFSAPMLGLHVPEPLAALAAALKGRQSYVERPFNPYTELFLDNLVTRDERRFARNRGVIEAEPSLALGAVTAGWVKAALASMARLRAGDYLKKIVAPVAIVSAQHERLVSNSAQARAAGQLAHAKHVLIRGAYHELLQERDGIRAAFWQAFDELVSSRVH